MAISYFSENEFIELERLEEASMLGGLQTADTDEKTRALSGHELIPAFSPVGIGKPLAVEIMTVYTGDAPRKFLGGKPDLMVVSGIKSFQTFDTAPRAVNLIVENIEDSKYIEPSAFTDGSPVVYYTPSLDASTVFLSFELVVDSIRKDSITAVSNLFSLAAGLPIFAPANSYLLAGATIVKLVGDLVNAFESAPFLTGNIDLRFLTSGLPVFQAGHYLMYSDEHAKAFKDYRTGTLNDGFNNLRLALVHKSTGEAYTGAAPYILINIDGRERPELDGFAPKLASAALLEQFYGRNQGKQIISTLDKALELYNDMEYRNKAERILEKLGTFDPNSDEYLLARLLFDAYNRNIKNPIFRMEWPS